MQLCIFEDTHYVNFQPLVYFRPVYDLRCGVSTLHEKIESVFSRANIVLHVRKELEAYARQLYPQMSVNHLSEEDTWFINGRILAGREFARTIQSHDQRQEVFLHDENGVGAAFVKGKNVFRLARYLKQPLKETVFQNLPMKKSSFQAVRYLWDIVYHTAEEIENDVSRIRKNLRQQSHKVKIPQGAHLIHPENIFLGSRCIVKPGVVLDAEQGAIVIGDDVTIMPNAVIQGPAYIGNKSIVKIGAKIYHGTSIGEYCKVGGEIEASVMQSYSNKQHDGYLGHSYIGSWVNLGADTNTSDLKNTYGTVKVENDGAVIDTGMQFIGLIMGDHSKTGINAMFDTGAIVGISCNIYGAEIPPKFIPSFSWGEKDSLTVFQLKKGLETARRVFARRDVEMTDVYEKLFRKVYALTDKSRKNAGVK